METFTESYAETYERLLQEELAIKKQFINYDKLIDDLISAKEMKILEWRVKMKQVEMAILALQNDIVRIRKEQKNSNYKYCHCFVDPHIEYCNRIKKE